MTIVRKASGKFELLLPLSEAEAKKLLNLAEASKKSPEQCLLDFIATCQPGGTGWKHPASL